MYSAFTTTPSEASTPSQCAECTPTRRQCPPTHRRPHVQHGVQLPGAEDLRKAEPGQKTIKTWENVYVKASLVLRCILILGFISSKEISLKFCIEMLTAMEKENL